MTAEAVASTGGDANGQSGALTSGAPAQGQGEGASAVSGANQQTAQGGTQTTHTQESDWTGTLDEDLKGFVQNKGFEKPADVLNSYRNLEKLVGAPKERLVKLPEDMSDAEQMAEVYNRLGRPSKSDEYDIKFGEGNPEDFQKWTKDTFHKLGLTQAQAQKMVESMDTYSDEIKQASLKEQEQKVAEEQKALQKEWGQAYEQNTRLAKRAAREVGVDGDTVEALAGTLGFAKTMKLFQKVAEATGEADFVSGGQAEGTFGVMTPEAAKNRINALKSDSGFIKRYQEGDVAAIKEMSRLHEMAYVEQEA